ncbi:ABC transporter permease [Pseudomonas schmalbachii]|uniref:Transport permease protein n=1 Tax=Pseudomonas schmalbachii TaxID=2816993 RepID=A0ABS3TRE3_9PSED|nr:ABC transporter permease [Pseudomonas schmalbachii]MBO3276236.1 ABC transporter permease [Pseudomonas schmalbachii]
MYQHSLSPKEALLTPWRNRALIITLIKREVIGRYRGSALGILWSFFHPLLMLSVYTFVFGVIFKSRWGNTGGSKAEFALILFSGLLVFSVFSECINRAPSLILSNSNYVKKVIFPIEILPLVSLGSALFHLLVSLSVWLGFYIFIYGLPRSTIFLFPLILLPILFFTLGISWFLASLGVFLRDVSQITGIITTILMFMSPIFFPLSALPEKYHSLLLLNPLTPTIEMTRDVLIWGNQPNWPMLTIYLLLSILVSILGFAWFQKTRKGFADVL